ncbi:unnamed protein product [Gongylonema pulchrum]|uniref:Bromo domain-containing protein n=1 Tax=Gongylonema pulchrum TaxID=637853 RepID=A0A183E2W8_9BILA|nr:unnamed protein product [Gongylonema pulchrum]
MPSFRTSNCLFQVVDNLITKVCASDTASIWRRRQMQRFIEKREEEKRHLEMQQRYVVSDQNQRSEVVDNLITKVCASDTASIWRRRQMQRFVEKREEEKRHLEMQQRTVRNQRLAVRQLEAQLGERIERFTREVTKRRIKLEDKAKAEAGMAAPLHTPGTVLGKGGVSARTVSAPGKRPSPAEFCALHGVGALSRCLLYELKFNKKKLVFAAPATVPAAAAAHSHSVKASSISLPAAHDARRSDWTANLSTNTPPSVQRASVQPSSVASGLQMQDTSQQRRRSERSRKTKTWDESFITPKRRSSTSRTSSGSETPSTTKQSTKAGTKPCSAAHGVEPSTSAEPETADSGSIPTIDPTKTHCKCNQPYNPKKFYIACDVCRKWFHGRCVRISEKKAKEMTDWVYYLKVFGPNISLQICKFFQQLYCVCQTPYDCNRFYVGCDSCDGWFHPECVGTTQEYALKFLITYFVRTTVFPEALDRTSKIDVHWKLQEYPEAEKVAEYVCPQCIRSKQGEDELILSRADFALLWQVLDNLKEHRTSWPFREPVDAEEHPDYYKIIKKPMGSFLT